MDFPRYILLYLSLLITPLIQVFATEASDKQMLDMIKNLAADDEDKRQIALTELVDTGDTRLENFFELFRIGSVYLWKGEPVIGGDIRMTDDLDEFVPLSHPLTTIALLNPEGNSLEVLIEDLTEIDLSRADRKKIQSAKFQVALFSPNPTSRLAAVKRLGDPPRKADSIPLLERVLKTETDKRVRYTAEESLLLINVTDRNIPSVDRLASADTLGEMKSARAFAVISAMVEQETFNDTERETYKETTEEIGKYQKKIDFFDNFKRGLSTGSILILIALGLAITFGMMGIINMAHGEMMMIGAYTTFCMQAVFGHTSSEANNLFFVFALPCSFIISALVGGLIEWGIVRHLYKRPLESLLATFGVSLVLIQVVRLIFGDNQASNSPTWLVGSFEIVRGMSLPYARLFVFLLTIVCLLAIGALMKFTRLGLHMRATMQNRPMANAMGINTRAIDLFTFMLGSGIAGVAGCALTTIGGITPDMGQNYIIDSFLVVVAGGVGKLLGVVCSGLGLGVIGQVLEGNFLSPVWSKIVILIALIGFIQFRPAGLFPPKGRLADDA